MASQPRFQPTADRLKVSRYDQVASMLLALVILLSLAVLILLVTWFTNKVFLRQASVPVELTEIGSGEGEPGGREIEGPMDREPGAVADLRQSNVEETLMVVAQALDDQMALIDDPALPVQAIPGEGGGSHGRGGGWGSGVGRGRGTGTPRNWEIRFLQGNTLKTYARQLDFFHIELGVLLPNNELVYVSNLTKPKPDSRRGPADQEKRYYLTWRGGDLQEADRALLVRAGIDAGTRIILKFLPPAVESQLVALERAHAGPEAKDIRRTRFGLRVQGDGYEFYVMEQTYR